MIVSAFFKEVIVLKIEIEVEKCLEIIKEQKEKMKNQQLNNCFVGTDRMEIDTDFLIEKNVLVKRNYFYHLKDNYKDIIQREKVSNNPLVKKVDKLLFVSSPLTNIIKGIKWVALFFKELLK